ncbi:MAG: CZB domain-containing protein [Gammaproteobacteria bacterium]|nr:CZB domain-containing protein [Gammaproteobacteria bacterium]
MIDLNNARMIHIHWVEQMKNALKRGEIPVLQHYQDCDLGQWLYQNGSGGGQRFLTFEEGQQLEELHRQFHLTADEMTRMFSQKNYGNAEIMMREFTRESRDLVFLLSMLEYRLQQLKKAGRTRDLS